MLPITVAVPTHNRPRFLVRAVRSILQQSFEDFELVILDNGSQDFSWQNMPEFADSRIRLVRHPRNIGLINNWNAAIREARGDAICLFHDDDTMGPLFLESMVRFLAAAPSVGLSFALARRVDCLGNDLGVYWRPERSGTITGEEYIRCNLRHFGRVTLPPGVVITRAAYARVGGYSQQISQSAVDINLYLRVAMQFDVGIVDDVLVNYTLHPSQVSDELWRANEGLEAKVDVSLEMLGAAAWLLERPQLGDAPCREVSRVVRRVTGEVAEYVRKRGAPRRAL